MATKGITVKELYDDLRQEILAGNGDKTILISSDDEGNSYHTLWYTIQSDIDEIKKIKEATWFHDDDNPEEVDLLDGKADTKAEAKYDGSLESLFELISRAIESTVQICISEDSDLVSHLFDFGYEAMDLIKPCLYNKKAFDVVDMTSEVDYWIDAYKDEYSYKELARECCQAIVFNLFCIIDGVSSNNDFKIEKTAFDDTLQDAEFHQLWCEYLNKKQ